MRIKVKLFASLREGRFANADREFPDGTVVAGVLRAVSVPEKEAHILFLNSKHASPEDALHDGDTLSVFPLIGGGE